MPPTTELTPLLNEGSNYVYAPTQPLRYEDGTPVVPIHVESFTLTLVDVSSAEVLRNAVEVLDSVGDGGMGGQLNPDGYLRVPLTSADTRQIGTFQTQKRRMTFRLLTTAGVRLNWQVIFAIENFPDFSTQV